RRVRRSSPRTSTVRPIPRCSPSTARSSRSYGCSRSRLSPRAGTTPPTSSSARASCSTASTSRRVDRQISTEGAIMTTDINRRVLPGFGLSLGYTLLYMSLVVAIPMAAGFLKASQLSLDDFWRAAFSERALAAYWLTLWTAGASAVINVIFGGLVAWVLVRYEFPLKKLFDSLVDFPFALPTAVAGLVFGSLLVKNGWYGRVLVPLGIEGAYSRLGIVIVLVFIGFPFVVRTLQPVLESLERDTEEAAACLGANRAQTFRRVIMPSITPAVITGFALAFARSLGEYGSVVFISGNMPYKTEIAPVLVVARLEEFAYGEAAAIACVLLAMSFTTLLLINVLERWSKRHHG